MRSTKGQRIYACDDCGNRQFIHKKMFDRAARPGCSACGCARLTPVSKDGQEDIIARNRARVDGPHGSVSVASSSFSKHKRVV